MWCKIIIEDIKVLSYYVDVIKISDARLPEELDTIFDTYNNVTKINITRPDFNNNLNQSESKHLTETKLNSYNNYDYIINNDGTLEDLENKTIDILKNII